VLTCCIRIKHLYISYFNDLLPGLWAVGTIGKLSQSACWPSFLITLMALADYFGLHRCRPAAFMQQVCSGVGDIGTGSRNELQTFRTQDLSFPRTKGPYGELSFPRNERSLWRTFVPGNSRSRGTKVPWNFCSRALSFSETFVPGERKFRGTFLPGTFRTRELSFPLSDRPSRRFASCA